MRSNLVSALVKMKTFGVNLNYWKWAYYFRFSIIYILYNTINLYQRVFVLNLEVLFSDPGRFCAWVWLPKANIILQKTNISWKNHQRLRKLIGIKRYKYFIKDIQFHFKESIFTFPSPFVSYCNCLSISFIFKNFIPTLRKQILFPQ